MKFLITSELTLIQKAGVFWPGYPRRHDIKIKKLRETMTTTFKGSQIVANFKREMEIKFKIPVKFTSISRQVFEIDSDRKCLLYVKARSAQPIRWGVTANVISRLKGQKIPWCVVLLYFTHETGYLLTSDDVDYYIKNVWPLGADGDYKPSEGSYLRKNDPFGSLESMMEQLKKI